MILPTKHVRIERALIGVGAEILEILQEPMTVSRLWDGVRTRRSSLLQNAPIDYDWFILALDLLYLIDAVNLKKGIVVRSNP